MTNLNTDKMYSVYESIEFLINLFKVVNYFPVPDIVSDTCETSIGKEKTEGTYQGLKPRIND